MTDPLTFAFTGAMLTLLAIAIVHWIGQAVFAARRRRMRTARRFRGWTRTMSHEPAADPRSSIEQFRRIHAMRGNRS